MLGACAECESGLGKGIMMGADFPAFLPDDPDPGDQLDMPLFPELDYFTWGTEGLGGVAMADRRGVSGVLLSDRRPPAPRPGLGFTLPDFGGGDGGGGGGFTFGGYGGYDPNPQIYECSDGSTSPVPCDSGTVTLPAPSPTGGGGGSAPSGGPGINWGSIINNLINTAGGAFRASQQPSYPGGGYRITGYTPQGQPIYGGVSGGVALGPGGASGSLGISTNTLMLIAGGVLIYLVASGRRGR